MADLTVGCVVTLNDGRQATVRFVGSTRFATGDWVGVELEDGDGKNDGSVQGERYFECEPGYGMFVRPSIITAIVERPVRAAKPAARPAAPAQGRSRAPSGLSAGPGLRRPGSISSLNTKRQSVGASSPTPVPKGAAQRLSLMSPSRSPTKQLSTSSTPASGRSSGTTTPRPSAAATKARPTSTKGPMGPPPPPSAAPRAARTSISGSGVKGNRQSFQGPTGSTPGMSKRPALRPTASNNRTSEELTSPPADDSEPNSQDGSSDNPETADFAPKAAKPAPAPGRTASTRPSPAPAAPQRSVSNSAVTRELDELKTKLRVMEKKRADDREKLRTLEQLQSERDKYEGIIQKLQAKYQPQQLEITELRKKLKEAEARVEEIEKLQAEHETLMEIATLDREMAEETADALRHESEALRLKVEELQLEAEVLREENEELGQVMSPEEKSSHGWLQMEKTNERLREALLRLRDMTQQQESELKDQIQELQQDLEDYSAIKSQYEATKEKLLVSENNVEDLKQQLETALGAEEMIEELADKNMRYQEEINNLTAAIADLEDLKEINDELEWNHVETEKQLQEEIDHRKALFTEQSRRVQQQDEVIEDLEYTLTRFRELVSTLQADLEDMRASQQITEAEATDLTARSRAMMDLNLKLQSSVAKAQTKTIDNELKRIEADEDTQHLSIVKLYLPEYYETERNSVLALLRFKRVSSKASLMSMTVDGMVTEQSSTLAAEDVFTAQDILEKLLWIASICSRFENYISSCSAESFGSIQGSLFELEPVERTLNFWLEGLKKNELNMKKCAVELQRSIALLSHLAETLLPTSLETFADELCMRSKLTYSYIENAVSSMSRLTLLLRSKLPKSEDPDEEAAFLFGKMDDFVSQARSLKVAMGKIRRAVSDLQARSLALSHDACGPFKQAEDSAKDLSSLSRQLGENIVVLLSDESRAEPITLPEILTNMSQISNLYQSSEAGSENTDTMSFIFTMLHGLSGTLEELGSISSDLSITSEFEKRPFPWIVRAAELKSNKVNSPDAEEEIRRLKNEIHEASTALGVKDKTIEEQTIKVELVESRMREASKKAAAVKDLEAKIEEMTAQETNLKATVETQRKDLQAIEAERDEIKGQLERLKRMSGAGGGVTAATGVVVDNAVSLAAMKENEALRSEVQSLQAAVRFLREESRRATILDPYSVQRSAELYAWLDAPLSQKSITTPQREKIQQSASESRDVLAHLLKLTQESSPCDLKTTHNRTGWRPAKEKLRYQVLQQREDFERWTEWKAEVVGHEREQDRLVAAKKERIARQQGHASKPSIFGFPQGLGHGMMGRAWQILGMEQDARKTAITDQPVELTIASLP
ncbi:dynein associated protein-domain-containing protein [Aspergillus pseudodeflectus]|uniref:Dynein associated protein-domain-containing protein n=1 Tax=Aspergillus pseudodeflectus TaxID=176178 RepID=A0ABR4KHM3_9EURO